MSRIDQTSPAAPRPDKPRRPRWRRALRTAAIVLASLLTLVLVSTITNTALTASEKSALAPYGERVALAAGDINVVRNGGTGPVLVLLSGFGTAAPGIDFAPLIRELDAFDVIVIEGFGYGYSDLDVPERTVENITGEIHEVLRSLDVREPVILAGHSIGGLYTHYYANAYPGEVSGIIGIDPMVATTSSLEVGVPSTIEATLNSIGLVRLANALAPALVQPPGTAFTAEERERFAPMANWTFGNASVAEEWARLGANSTTAAAKPLPAGIPVLEMIASASIASDPGWLENHERELAGVTTHQLELLDGGHYLHWTQAPAMGRLIAEFVSAHINS